MNKKIIINIIASAIVLALVSWMILISNNNNMIKSASDIASSLANENRFDEAKAACEKLSYRKGSCYSAILEAIIARRNNGEELPVTTDLCNKIIPENTTPVWAILLRDREEYNRIMEENNKRCLSRIDATV